MHVHKYDSTHGQGYAKVHHFPTRPLEKERDERIARLARNSLFSFLWGGALCQTARLLRSAGQVLTPD